MATIFVPAGQQTITVGPGNLFQVAAQYLGDATKWNQISDINPALNGDPYFYVTTTLNLPPNNVASNGGLIAR